MHIEEIRESVKNLKRLALNFEWAQLQQAVVKLEQQLNETPADIRKEKDGYWL